MSNNEQPNESNRQRGQRLRRQREQAEREQAAFSLPPSSATRSEPLGPNTLIPPALTARQLVRQGKRPRVEQIDRSLPSSSHTIRADIGPDTATLSNRQIGQLRRQENARTTRSIEPDTATLSNRQIGQLRRQENARNARTARPIPQSSDTGPFNSVPPAVDSALTTTEIVSNRKYWVENSSDGGPSHQFAKKEEKT